jgi:hypothetical protein
VQAVIWGIGQAQSITRQSVTDLLPPGATITVTTTLLTYGGSQVHVIAQGISAP